MGLGIGTIVGTAVGGPIGFVVGAGYDAAKENADAQKEAAAAATYATIEAARIAAEAQKEAMRLSIAAQKEATAEAVAAAQAAEQKAIDAVMRANVISQQAIQAGADFSNAEFQSAYDTIQNRLTPWVQQGTKATQGINALMGFEGPEAAKNALLQDPSYQFRRDQGQQAVERSAIGRGNFMSGNTGIELQQYGQDMASQEFNNAFNRLMALSQQGYGAASQAGQYDWQRAGVRATNQQGVQNAISQGATNEANTRTNAAWNIAQAQGGGAQNIANATVQGAQNQANVIGQGAYNVGNAQGQQAFANAGADASVNNYLPQVGMGLINSAIGMAPIIYGASSGGGYGSSYRQPTNAVPAQPYYNPIPPRVGRPGGGY